MLGRIGQNDQNSEILTQGSNVEKVQNGLKGNPYANIDKNLLIDETNISDDAMKLWERENDIKKFTKLALSDPEDNSAEKLVKDAGAEFIDDKEAFYNLIKNQKFLEDIAF